jgi:hypothetical protein
MRFSLAMALTRRITRSSLTSMVSSDATLPRPAQWGQSSV